MTDRQLPTLLQATQASLVFQLKELHDECQEAQAFLSNRKSADEISPFLAVFIERVIRLESTLEKYAKGVEGLETKTKEQREVKVLCEEEVGKCAERLENAISVQRQLKKCELMENSSRNQKSSSKESGETNDTLAEITKLLAAQTNSQKVTESLLTKMVDAEKKQAPYMNGWLVGWLFFFYITKQTGNSAQYYDGDGIWECEASQLAVT